MWELKKKQVCWAAGCSVSNNRHAWFASMALSAWDFVTPIFMEQMECIILYASKDQSHIR
jgi:hypothetical protein